MMITPRIKNYITGIMSVTVGVINVVFFIRMLLPDLQQNIFFLPLWFFFFIPGIIGLLPIPLSRFDKPLETRAFINILCFFLSSITLVYLGLFFLRIAIMFPSLLLSFLVLIVAQRSKILSKKGLLLIMLVIMAFIIVPYFWLSISSASAYEKTIVRNTSNVEEANALTITENINYSGIFDLQKFTTSKFSEKWPYAWANFIDAQVIEYYDYRFENLKVGPRSIMKPRSIKFHYETNVSTWDQIRVVYVPAPKDNIYADAIQVLGPDGSVLSENRLGLEILCAYRNDSKYQRIEYSMEYPMIRTEEINFSLSKSYAIEMKLKYDENWGPMTGFYARVYQYIIVDEDFEPLLLCIESTQYIS